MPGIQITASEAVEILKRSSLPSVITEGSDDYFVFRRIEENLSGIGVSLMPVGGRDEVLNVFRRRSEFGDIPVAFIVDRDMWVVTGVPEEFDAEELVITDGYSIENDLFRDGNLYDIMTAAEKQRFDRDVRELCKWFAYESEIYVAQGTNEVALHVDRVVQPDGTLCLRLQADRG